MTDQEIIKKLIDRDNKVTDEFFFKNCRPLFIKIIKLVFPYNVDYDEFVNEFYVHLMEDDCRRLRQFEGRSTVYQWIKIVAIRYFIAKRDRMIDDESEEPLIEKASESEVVCPEKQAVAKMDVARIMNLMPNRRYAYVIMRLVLQDAEPKIVAKELGVSVDNLYNIKKRAIFSFTEIALNEVGKYEQKGDE